MNKHRLRKSLVGLPYLLKVLICERRCLMITRRNVRDGKSSRSVEGNQICGEIGVPLELVFCEEANDRPHTEQLYFINPIVHFSP